MIVTVERLDNGDLVFRCSICDETLILPHQISTLSTTRYFYRLGQTLAKIMYHDTSHIRQSGREVRTGDIGGHNGTI